MANRKDIIIISVISGVFVLGMILMMVFVAMSGAQGDGYITSGGGQIAVVEIYGGIYDPSVAVRQLERWSEDDNIKSIVIHMDSPGGGVAASQEIYEAVKRARDEFNKNIVVAIQSVGASGGYYIACAADVVVANPGSITGSIGVILQYPTFGRLMDKVGVDYEVVKSGELKDIGNFSRRMTDEEEVMLRGVIMDTYEQFVGAVARGRGMEKEAVYPLADGRIFTGLQAKNLGLVDTLGTFNDAVKIAADLGNIEGKPETVKEVPKRPGLFDIIGETFLSIKGAVDRPESMLKGPQILYLYN